MSRRQSGAKSRPAHGRRADVTPRDARGTRRRPRARARARARPSPLRRAAPSPALWRQWLGTAVPTPRIRVLGREISRKTWSWAFAPRADSNHGLKFQRVCARGRRHVGTTSTDFARHWPDSPGFDQHRPKLAEFSPMVVKLAGGTCARIGQPRQNGRNLGNF